MDLIVIWTIRLWLWAIAIAGLPILMLALARGTVGLLRFLPSVRRSLQGTADGLARWSDRFQYTFIVLFVGAALWPVVVVALPVAGLTWLLFRWLVPDTPPADDAEHDAPARALEWPLRLVTITTLGQLLATAVLLWLRKQPTTPIVVGMIDGSEVHVDRLIVLTASVFLPFGFGLLLSGTWVSTLGRALVVGVMLVSTQPPVWSGAPAALWGLLVVAFGACATVPAFHKASQPASAWTFVGRAVIIMVAFGTYLVAMAATLSASEVTYATWLNQVVSSQVFLVTPVLFLSGVDFAAIGAGLSRRVTRWTLVTESGVPAAVIAVIVAGASIAFAISIGGIDATGLGSLVQLGLALVVVFGALWFAATGVERLGVFGLIPSVALLLGAFAGLFALFYYTEWRLLATAIAAIGVGYTFSLIRPRAAGLWSPAGLTMAAIVVMAVVMAGAREAVVLVRAAYEIPPNARTIAFRTGVFNTPTGVVSTALPTFWTERQRGGYLYFGDGPDPYATGAFILATIDPQTIGGLSIDNIEGPLETLLKNDGLPAADLSFTQDYTLASGEWRRSEAVVVHNQRRYRVDVFHHYGRGAGWLLIFVSGDRYERYFAPAVVGVLDSWRFDDSASARAAVPPPDLRRRVADVARFGLLPVLFAPVGFWMLVGRRETRPSGTLRDHAAVLAIVVTATAVLFLPDTALVEFRRGSGATANPLATLQFMLAGATILVVALFALGRQLATVRAFVHELASVNVALLLMAALYAFYGALILFGDRYVELEVTVFLVLLALDIFTSGREITSAQSPGFPRAARVLTYSGYLLVVATIALFVSTQTVASTGASLPKLLESEDIARQGLVWLGAPVLLLRAVLRWAESTRRGWLED